MKTPPHVCLYPSNDKSPKLSKPVTVNIDFRDTNILIIELDKLHKIKQVDLAGGNICQPVVSKILNGDTSIMSLKTMTVFGKQFDMVGGITKSVDSDIFAKVSRAYLNDNKRQFAAALEVIKYRDLIDVIDKLRYHAYDLVLLNFRRQYQQVVASEVRLEKLVAQTQYIRIELLVNMQLAIAYLNLAQDTEFERTFAKILALLRQYQERQELHDELHYMYAMVGYELLQRHMRLHGLDAQVMVLSRKMKVWHKSQSFHAGFTNAVIVLDQRLKNK
ncbi:hypothetical protein [Periweissella ghanensis]|uniref:Uncharacterized protein n=1 Tax=Periweissella ghanensis TaxID=467997 RepID=A0ABN8BQ00_9LACO|nr:hypothetical protein [Periweissella ghanensis]MCM0601607.1 hypothetical protein [Periweissella ghanensis]CAH0418684.1 hypothetical protein WGH24286_01115 [Periweissella ghanensis]